ncbi:tRNA (adenosine(37)-N6)-threonylcarbamoyltransferase complex dimerization subunit type 1 TsaB [Mariprofundus sp. KV]|uniref:tRNA (adenosine(37)-N6)-threonylcarbamoyltransferase complex dimerization subunit type 1 TsaB n=1 Tax=Mariprofundus sp. KV TaxID=2608715 RepID=UPI0015A28B9B|nr:tRNA (adenosine(37)-N6)-threonylcarbamoyltransferase complex dimerization subunit type 1 TsaB [Mariprofundus sp. KV]
MKSDLHILALDTAFGEISACMHTADGAFLTAATPEQGKTRSTAIVPLLAELLQQAGLTWNQLDLLALGAGPGAFTGLRIAAATLAGINSGLNLPMLHLSSLAITARQCDSSEAIWVLEDARAGEAFVGCYQNGSPRCADQCLTWHEVMAMQAGLFVCHNDVPVALDGWSRLPLTVSRSQALLTATLAELDALASISQLPRYPAPVYLQRSQAEKNLHG